MEVAWNLFLAAFGTIIVWKSSDRLEEAGNRISTHYGVPEIVKGAMEMLKVDASGFDTMDRRLLRLVIDHFDGGPVGIESIAAALSEERGTVEDVLEPYLIQQGYITRTSRGRMVTAKAYRHFGLEQPGNGKLHGESDLFSKN